MIFIDCLQRKISSSLVTLQQQMELWTYSFKDGMFWSDWQLWISNGCQRYIRSSRQYIGCDDCRFTSLAKYPVFGRRRDLEYQSRFWRTKIDWHLFQSKEWSSFHNRRRNNSLLFRLDASTRIMSLVDTTSWHFLHHFQERDQKINTDKKLYFKNFPSKK